MKKFAPAFCSIVLSMALHAQIVTVLRHINIINGTGSPLQSDKSLVIKDGIISGIEQSGNRSHANATVIDLTGKYIMPLIINAHGHLGILKDTATSAANYTAANIKRQLLRYQQYGVGDVVVMGSDQPLILPMRDASRAGELPGATIYSAMYGFGVKNAVPPVSMGMTNVYRPQTPEEAIKQVDSVAALKPDVIKIWVDDSYGQLPKMKPDIYTAIIKEAHLKGLRVAAHLYYLEDARKLVNAGLDIMAHSIRDAEVDDDLIAAMKKNNVAYIPTLSLDEFAYIYSQDPPWINDPFFKASLEPGVFDMVTSNAYKEKISKDPKTPKEKAAVQVALKNLIKLYRAGIFIVLGTDSGAMPVRAQGFSEHMEMELMVLAGLTPSQAITVATQNGAKLLHASQSGTLQLGKQADFIILNGNPLTDIRNTRKILSVWKNGKQVSGDTF